jgi:LAS superfamily LD-carboxypeptidase LdcB
MTAVLTGKAEGHLCTPADARSLGALVHQEVVDPFRSLTHEARAAGFDLRIFSGFRSFAQQLSIWNRKASGKLPVLDSNAVPLDVEALSEPELVFAILRWSALPGASRHHWGTDLDVYDAAATPEGYEIELIPEEVNAGGMFGPLHEWLDERIATESSFGFFRPYDEDREGVAPERWHVSYGPVAAEYLEQLTPEVLQAAVGRADLLLKDTVLLSLDEIHQRFIVNVNAFGRVS